MNAPTRTVPCKVHIRRVSDGLVRVYDLEWCIDFESPEYIWEEGNFKCDCNRHLFFEYAAGRESMTEIEQDPGYGCSSGRFKIDKIELEDGSIVYKEPS